MYSIEHLNIITSSFCDLKCSYCFLHKNQSFRKYDKYILQSWKDGSYIENIKKLFIKLECDPKKVEDISFWGGEPFLHLDILTLNIEELLKLFPNVKSFIVPTNFVHTDAKELCHLFKIIDRCLSDREEDNKAHFHVQASIDGIEGDIFMETGHTGSWKLYKKNFDEMCDILSSMNLKNLEINLAISGTGKQEYFLKYFQNEENIKKYIEFWENAKNYIYKKIKDTENPKIELNSKINFPTIALPEKTSSEQAIDIHKIIKLLSKILYQDNASYGNNDHLIKEYFNCETDWPLCGHNHECPEANQRAITVLPDGTITQCPSGFIEHIKEYQDEILSSGNLDDHKRVLIAAKQFFNPLTASEKENEDHKWYNIMGGFKDTFFTYINLGFSMAQELALSHQIDEIYSLDSMLLLKHLTAASTINECFRESIRTTGLSYMGGHDLERRWLNGYIAEAYDFHKAEILDVIKLSLKEKKERSK